MADNSVNKATLTGSGWLCPSIVTEPQSMLGYGKATYAAEYGVTGNNDGTRDDTPLLQAAYAAAAASGSRCLIMPVGEVYLKSFTVDAVYPYSYVVRVAVDDFTVIVPDGCRIHCTFTGDSGALTQWITLFQIHRSAVSTVYNSHITGGGEFVHDTPGYTGATPNNYINVVLLSSYTDKCSISNLRAKGYGSPVIGVFDSSSAFRTSMNNLYAENCGYGPRLSSSAATVRGFMTRMHVKDFYQDAVTWAANNTIVDQVFVEQTVAAGGISIGNANGGEFCQVSNIKIIGYSGSYPAYGYVLQQGNASPTDTTNLTNFDIQYCAYGVLILGGRNMSQLTSGRIRGSSYGIWKSKNGTYNCSDLVVEGVKISNVAYALLATDKNSPNPADATENAFILRDVQMQANSGIYYNTTAVVKYPINVSPAVPLARRIDYQVAASAASVTATAGINDLTTMLTGTTATALTSPASPSDGQTWTVVAGGAAVTLTGASGATIKGSTSVAAGVQRTLRYQSSDTTWY